MNTLNRMESASRFHTAETEKFLQSWDEFIFICCMVWAEWESETLVLVLVLVLRLLSPHISPPAARLLNTTRQDFSELKQLLIVMIVSVVLTSCSVIEGVSQACLQGSQRSSSHHPSVAPVQEEGPVPSISSCCVVSQVSSAAVPPPGNAPVFDGGRFGQRHLHPRSVDLGPVHEAQRGDGVLAAAVVDEGIVGELLDSLHAARFEARELQVKSFLSGAQHQVTNLQHRGTFHWTDLTSV